MIQVILADDHPIVRAGLRAILETTGTMQVVAEADSGASLRHALNMQPSFDLLFIDVRMPDFDPIVAVEEIRSQYPALKIVVLSSYDQPEYVHGLLNAGANGYILKDELTLKLVSALHVVLAGDIYLSPRIARVYVQQQRRRSGDDDRLAQLTRREREILRLIGNGLDNHEIGAQLTISRETVKNHLRNIYDKLGFTHRYNAIVFALRSGLALAHPGEER